jgi:hypothetical protein
MISNNFSSSLSLLRQYLVPFKRRVALLSLLLLGSIGLQLWAPQVVGTFLDQAQRGETSRVLLGTAVLFFLLTLGQKTIALYNTYLSEDLGWAATNRLRYREKFDAVLGILDGVLDVRRPAASFYLWPRTPIPDTEFARGLFAQQHVTVLPGSFLSRSGAAGDPGRNHVRLALVPPLDECIDAAERIKTFCAGL